MKTTNEKIQQLVEVMLEQVKKMVAEGKPLEQISAYNLQMLEVIKEMANVMELDFSTYKEHQEAVTFYKGQGRMIEDLGYVNDMIGYRIQIKR